MNILHCIPGPFFRKSNEDVWHWMKNCISCPSPEDIIEDPENFIATKLPDGKLCSSCMDIYKQLQTHDH